MTTFMPQRLRIKMDFFFLDFFKLLIFFIFEYSLLMIKFYKKVIITYKKCKPLSKKNRKVNSKLKIKKNARKSLNLMEVNTPKMNLKTQKNEKLLII